jgi:hypothetical protein
MSEELIARILAYKKAHSIKAKFDVTIGEKGLKNSWQKEFPKETKCGKCGGTARIGFVVYETKEGPFVADLHKNDPEGEGHWPHDVVAVAVYFCKDCLETTSLYNQG